MVSRDTDYGPCTEAISVLQATVSDRSSSRSVSRAV